MSIVKQTDKIYQAFRMGAEDKRLKRANRTKQMPKALRKAYSNGYKQGC